MHLIIFFQMLSQNIHLLRCCIIWWHLCQMLSALTLTLITFTHFFYSCGYLHWKYSPSNTVELLIEVWACFRAPTRAYGSWGQRPILPTHLANLWKIFHIESAEYFWTNPICPLAPINDSTVCLIWEVSLLYTAF